MKFNDDGSVKDFVFEKPTTFKELQFKETTGALDRMDQVAVQIIYRLSIKGTKKQAPITFQPTKETALFNKGIAKVAFYDPAMHW